jgi:hypothetical protein
MPPPVAAPVRRLAEAAPRDSKRASRSGGAVKIALSLIGDGLGIAPGVSPALEPRAFGLMAPVTEGSARALSEEARDSRAACRLKS